MEEQGEAPRRWVLSEPRQSGFGQRLGAARHRAGPPTTRLPGGNVPHPRYQARFTGSLGWCPGNWKLSQPPRGPRVFPRTTLPSRSPTPAEAECPGKTWGTGARAGGRPRFPAGWSRPERARHTPTDVFSHGDSSLSPAWAAKFLALAQTFPPCPEQQTWTKGLQLSKVCVKAQEKGL